MTTDVEDINNSLKILLSTRPGERVMFPNYGCDLQEMLFKPLDLTLITQMKGIVERAILYHEPRINILSIEIDTRDELEGEVLIQVDYEVRNTNTRSNIVFLSTKEKLPKYNELQDVCSHFEYYQTLH